MTACERVTRIAADGHLQLKVNTLPSLPPRQQGAINQSNLTQHEITLLHHFLLLPDSIRKKLNHMKNLSCHLVKR